MSDAAGTSILTPDQVTQIISQAESCGGNPILLAIQIFNSLGDNVTLPGNTLALALTQSRIPIPGPLVPLVNAIQSISKTGNHITITINQIIETLLNNSRVRFQENVHFDVSNNSVAPALNNVVGVAAHKLLSWINIQSIQLKQDKGIGA
jgi:hypothetical protein